MPRGTAFQKEYQDRLDQDRLAQPTSGGCLWCPELRFEGTLEQVKAASDAHRAEHHPKARNTVVRSKRSWNWAISKNSFGDNLARAREQGAAQWASEKPPREDD